MRPEDVEPRAAAAAPGDLPQHRGQVQPEPPGAGPRQPQPRDQRAGGQLALAARHEARHGPQPAAARHDINPPYHITMMTC